MKKIILGCLIMAAFCFAASAQNSREEAETRLVETFRFTNVQLKLDLPASAKGVEILAGKQISTDAEKNLKRIKAFGTAFRTGDTALVTGIRVTKDEISFELDGGGMPEGDLGGAAGPRPVPTRPSAAESTARNRIESAEERNGTNNTGNTSRRDMEQDRSRVKYETTRRKETDLRAEIEYKAGRKDAIERARAERVKMGSRFVIKFEGRDTAFITPDELKRLLADYVAF